MLMWLELGELGWGRGEAGRGVDGEVGRTSSPLDLVPEEAVGICIQSEWKAGP